MYFDTQLFNRTQSEVFQLFTCDPDDSAPTHVFGGEPGRKGEIPPGRRKRVHLFYDLDLSDPLVDIRSPRPEITRLPLYYALGNTGGTFAYRLISDTAIRLLCDPYPKDEYVPKPYPKPFAREAFYLQEIGYDANDPEWLWSFGALLGVGSLTEAERKQTLKKLEAFHRKRYDESIYDAYANWFHDRDYCGNQDDPDLAELVRMFNPFTQGMPMAFCPYAKCRGHKEGARLPVIAYLRTSDEGYDFKEDQEVERLLAGADSGQLIWMVCPLCLSVVVDNPCT
jgi:hypothetical protein